MTHVVTDGCIRCKYTDCVDVCPVDCFKEGGQYLVIDPEECIDCAVCISECPVNAIYADIDLPGGMEVFLDFNRNLAPDLPTISKRQPPLPDADRWKTVPNKLAGLKASF